VLRARLVEQDIRAAIGLPGDGDRTVDGVAERGSNLDRCLYWVDQRSSADAHEWLAPVRGAIVIAPTGSGLSDRVPNALVLEVGFPRQAIAAVLSMIRDGGLLEPLLRESWISPSAVIAPSAVVNEPVSIGDGVHIDAHCTVGADVTIGAGTTVDTGARILSRTVMGERCVVGANAVIGSEGYGFVRDERGDKIRIPQLAGVVLGSRVEVGALAVVQRGSILPTTIEDHAKIGDHVQIAHGVVIGRGTSIVGQSVVGGSARIGEETWLGLHATIRNSCNVGSRCLIGMSASVQSDVPDDSVVRQPAAVITPRAPDADPSTIGFTG
jgi:UDP-3-O-[3-hydroxymyristoyl] glucosamine N-acyltransferase LpxD